MRAMALGGGFVGLLSVGLSLVTVGLGVAAALDFFGKPGLGGSSALVSGSVRCVDLGFGRLHIPGRAQLLNGAPQGVDVLGGELLQGADENGGPGQADGNGLPAGFRCPLPAGLRLEAAALTMCRERIVALVGAVLRLSATVAGGRCGALVAAWIGALRAGGYSKSIRPLYIALLYEMQ